MATGAAATGDRTTVGSYLKGITTNLTSSMQAAGNLALTARQDASLSGTLVDAGHDLFFIAGGNIDLSAVKDEKITTGQ